MPIIILDTLHSHYIPRELSESIAMLRLFVTADQGLAELKAKYDAGE